MVTLAAVVALLAILAMPLWRGAGAPHNGESQTLQASNLADRLAD